jgi:hypothetical protein
MHHNNLIRIPNTDIAVSRIFSIERLEQLFLEKTLVLVRPKKWEDPFENCFLQCYIEETDGTRISMEHLMRDWYGLCWTRSLETDALWRIYSHPPIVGNKDEFQGIRISTTLNKLVKALWDTDDTFASLNYFIGSVRYETQADIETWLNSANFLSISIGGQNVGFAETLLIKRTAFSHEDEIRMLACATSEKAKRRIDEGDSNLFRVSIDPAGLIDGIMVDPRLQPKLANAMIARVRNLGYKGSVSQSDLYQFNPRAIRVA